MYERWKKIVMMAFAGVFLGLHDRYRRALKTQYTTEKFLF
jgi:hypothetical protein